MLLYDVRVFLFSVGSAVVIRSKTSYVVHLTAFQIPAVDAGKEFHKFKGTVQRS